MQLQDQTPPTLPGDREEDPAKTGPQIRLRTGGITILPCRGRRARNCPVFGGQTPRHRPRLTAQRLEEADGQTTRCLLKKTESKVSLSYDCM